MSDKTYRSPYAKIHAIDSAGVLFSFNPNAADVKGFSGGYNHELFIIKGQWYYHKKLLDGPREAASNYAEYLTPEQARDRFLEYSQDLPDELAELRPAEGPSPLAPAADLTGTPADDPTAFRPASDFLDDDRVKTPKAINKVLKDNPWIRRQRPKGKNGKPIKNRLQIHAGDWHEFIKRQRQTVDVLDQPANMVDAVMDVEERKAKIRKQKDDVRK